MMENYLSMQQRMKKLFTEGFSVMDIVEPLPVVDSCSPAAVSYTHLTLPTILRV